MESIYLESIYQVPNHVHAERIDRVAATKVEAHYSTRAPYGSNTQGNNSGKYGLSRVSKETNALHNTTLFSIHPVDALAHRLDP